MEESPNIEFMPVPNGTVYDGKILSFCYYKARKASEIAQYIEMSDSSYFRKNILDNLVKCKYLEKTKMSRSNYFKTNRNMVRIG